ncbi:MAG: uroporphyrinogen decarboxylase [Chloroflexi bacterium]|nr:uroporphyrinogen decarboxylase [Chloroflexota bacterium]
MPSTKQSTGLDRFLKTLRLQQADATPVWFMRQAGRSLPEYRELRKKYDLLTMAKNPELCAQVTLMPVKRLGVDGAVIFADIMLPLEGMGVPFTIEPEVGPVIGKPVRTAADVDAIRIVEAASATPYLFEALRLVRKEIGEQTAVIGFSGSPFTLCCYLIEGGPSRTYDLVRGLMYRDPQLWHRLMEKVTEVVVRYLREQANSGVHVAQLFDSWVGVLSREQYARFVLPYSKRIFTEMRTIGLPSIHFGTGTAHLLEVMASAGADVMSLDWRVPLDQGWARTGHGKGIQGNLDPSILLAPYDVIAAEARKILRMAQGRPGHIFNLGHGVLPQADPENLARLVDLVHNEPSR